MERFLSHFKKADIACIAFSNFAHFNFIKELSTNLNIPINFISYKSSHKKYKKIIICNGFQEWARPYIERIPPEKRIYAEVAFFPQNQNVYFDPKGIHGHSSMRDAALQPLSSEQQESLETFRDWYTKRNFTKRGWTHIDIEPRAQSPYSTPFLLVALQLEHDTAYTFSPFSSNQEMISFLESTFPEKQLIFKTHPHDFSSYAVSNKNILLPPHNTDLQILLKKTEGVIAINSTVLLEALLHRKKCASFGAGFSTNHNVCLECHKDLEKINQLTNWEPDWERIDQFLHMLLQKQISKTFWKSPSETEKLISALRDLGVPTDHE